MNKNLAAVAVLGAIAVAAIVGRLWWSVDRSNAPSEEAGVVVRPERTDPPPSVGASFADGRSDAQARRDAVEADERGVGSAEAEPSAIKVPPWAEDIVRECELTETELSGLLASPDLVALVREQWKSLSAGYGKLVSERSQITGRISKERQRAGRYELFKPEERLPDGDPRLGEFLAYGYERNPAGGRDLVRVIRILPGEDLEFDRVREAEASLLAERRAVVGRMIRGR